MKLAILLAALSFKLLATAATAQVKTVETRTIETDLDSLGDGKVIRSETVTSMSTTEDMTAKKHMVIIDPIKFFSLFNAGYQHAVTENITIGGNIQATTQIVDAKGWGVAFEGRYYPDGHPFRDFHVDASLAYNDITADHSEWDYDTGYISKPVKIAPLAAGVRIGWHWYPWKNLAAEFALGADYNF